MHKVFHFYIYICQYLIFKQGMNHQFFAKSVLKFV